MVDPDGHCPDCPPPPPPSIFTTLGGAGLVPSIIANPGRALDIVQTTISVVGIVPGAGEIADGVNAAISTARGNYGEAALDVAGMAGPVGSAAAAGNRIRKLASKANKVTDVIIDAKRYPEAAKNIVDAQKAGKPSTLTIDRAGAKNRRRESLKGTKRAKGKDRDEYPPAVTKEGGKGAFVRPISQRDNRGAGASMGRQIQGLPNGARIRIKVKQRVE